MGAIKCLGKRIFFAGNTYKMHMILHKTVGKKGERIFPAVFAYPGKILTPIAIIKKNILTVITALGDMVGQSNCYYSGYAGHNSTIPHP